MKAALLLFASGLLFLAGEAMAEAPGPAAPAALQPVAAPRYTLDNVYIEHFQARDATLSDVLEALSVISDNATKHHYRPTFVVIGANVSARAISMNISGVPLSAAIARLEADTGLRVTHTGDSVIFSPRR
jgi:hypothetical protein